MIIRGKTKLADALIYKAFKNNWQPISHDLFLAQGDAKERVHWSYDDWAWQGFFHLPKRIKIEQGKRLFVFQYSKIAVNQKDFKAPDCR